MLFVIIAIIILRIDKLVSVRRPLTVARHGSVPSVGGLAATGSTSRRQNWWLCRRTSDTVPSVGPQDRLGSTIATIIPHDVPLRRVGGAIRIHEDALSLAQCPSAVGTLGLWVRDANGDSRQHLCWRRQDCWQVAIESLGRRVPRMDVLVDHARVSSLSS
jgi:hypothetical protein